LKLNDAINKVVNKTAWIGGKYPAKLEKPAIVYVSVDTKRRETMLKIICDLSKGKSRNQIQKDMHVTRNILSHILRDAYKMYNVTNFCQLIPIALQHLKIEDLGGDTEYLMFLDRDSKRLLDQVATGMTKAQIGEKNMLTGATIQERIAKIRMTAKARTTDHLIAMWLAVKQDIEIES
jgi:DNA-binding CsgD family transcriptional regulator